MFSSPTFSASFSSSGRAKKRAAASKQRAGKVGSTQWPVSTRKPVSWQVRAMRPARASAAPGSSARVAAMSRTGMRPSRASLSGVMPLSVLLGHSTARAGPPGYSAAIRAGSSTTCFRS